MKHKFYLLVLLVFVVSCNQIEPRKPIQPKPSTTILSTVLEESKKINSREDAKITAIISKDSTSTYLTSPYGFWYKYDVKIDEDTPKPILGNTVSFEYEIYDLNDNLIYSKEELGIKTYKVDKEDLITGLQKGIKQIKVGETITFLIPSYNAFGLAGDDNRIGINQSIKSKITLLNIK